MNLTIKFDNQPQFVTIKIDNKAINCHLPSKLKSEQTAISQEFPGQLFGWRGFCSHVTSPAQKAGSDRFSAQLTALTRRSAPPSPEGRGVFAYSQTIKFKCD